MLIAEAVRTIPAIAEQGTCWWLIGGHYRGDRLIAKPLTSWRNPQQPPDPSLLSASFGDDWKPSRRWVPTLVWADHGWDAQDLAQHACSRCGRIHKDDDVTALAQKVDPNGYDLTWSTMQDYWCRQAEGVRTALAVG